MSVDRPRRLDRSRRAPRTPAVEVGPRALQLLTDALLILGMGPEAARSSAVAGRFLVGSQRVHFTGADDGTSLVFVTRLPGGWASSPEGHRQLLLANAHLLRTAGAIAAAGPAGLQLMSRWQRDKAPPEALANWLEKFAALAAGLIATRH